MNLNYKTFYPTDLELVKLRKELYHSEGNGYIIFKNYIPQTFVNHIVSFWTESINLNETHIELKNKKDLFFGHPNCYNYNSSKDNVTIRNFLWNKPNDMVTHTISYSIQVLRNVLMTKPIYNEIYPTNNRAVIPRIIITKQGSPVPMHTDWLESHQFDPSRLQATLFLSKKKKDYMKGGFCLEKNNRELVYFDEDVNVDPGDLVIWKYNNLHGVQGVESETNQKGFVRMVFPQDILHNKKSNIKSGLLPRYIKAFKRKLWN